jgi:hemerythrin-like domain-containing protein
MTEIMRVLRREHANIATLVKALDREAMTLVLHGEADVAVLAEAIDWFLSFPDVYHHPKEDLLFARLRRRDPLAADRVGNLRLLHEELAFKSRTVAEAVRHMLTDSAGPDPRVVDFIRQFIDMQVAHMRLEEDRFFPACIATFRASDWRELEALMGDQDDPLFGDAVDAHFERLRRTILTLQVDEEPLIW